MRHRDFFVTQLIHMVTSWRSMQASMEPIDEKEFIELQILIEKTEKFLTEEFGV